MNSQSPDVRLSLFRYRPYVTFFWARIFSEFSTQIATVAIGWQIYALTHSAMALGLAGLAQFIPSAALVFVAGHAADRYDRRRVAGVCQTIVGVTAAFLACGSFGGWLKPWELFSAVVVFGATSAFEGPASAALLTAVTPDGLRQKGVAVSTVAFQVAMISGPAIGGLASAAAPGAPYVVMAIGWFLASWLNQSLEIDRPTASDEPPTAADLFAGARFVRQHPAILGTISLDLFAVLLGGTAALLPVFARDILRIGPMGLGLLRAAPAAGALVMSALLARRPIEERAGLRMLQATAIFGLAIVTFALSRSVWLSILALAVMGAADTVSMVIRASLVQLATPDAMRGRVGAVNFLFINASSQLGEFESGLTATLFGAAPAALLGGLGTIAVALLWMKLFPSLRKLERLE